MRRTHVTARPVGVLRDRDHEQRSGIPKPRGLWYSVNGEWEEWCASEMPDWINGNLVYKVEVGAGCHLLRLSTPAVLRAFSEEYRCAEPMLRSSRLYGIDWPRVAEKYDGIEIAPYHWDCRLNLEFFWYYGWDCASGCLWRPRDTTMEEMK